MQDVLPPQLNLFRERERTTYGYGASRKSLPFRKLV